MSSVRTRLLATFGLALAATALSPAAAGAKSADPVDLDVHCVVYVVDKAGDGELSMSEPECFSTKAAAATRAAEPRLNFDLDSMDGSYTMASWTIGIHYNGYNGTGSSITVVGSSCTGGYWNTPGWFDNKISSSYNGCYRLRHYDLPNKQGRGANTYGVGTTDNLPSYMNNRTESVAYYSS